MNRENNTEPHVLAFTKNAETLFCVANRKAECGDYESAVSLLHEAYEISDDVLIMVELSKIYALMELYEESNQCCYYILAKGDENLRHEARNRMCANYTETGDIIGATYRAFECIDYNNKHPNSEPLDEFVVDAMSDFTDPPDDLNRYFSKPELDQRNKRKAMLFYQGKNFPEAIKYYKKTPKYLFNAVDSYEFATSYFQCGMDDKAKEECNYSLKRFGKNSYAYGVLSTISFYNKDYGNAEYYYNLAIECYKGNTEEAFRLSTCAMDMNDHLTVAICCKDALLSDKYNVRLKYYCGIALINLGEYKEAKEIFRSICRTVPEQKIYKYYLNLAIGLADGKGKEILPLSYDEVLPKTVLKEYRRVAEKFFTAKRLTAKETDILDEILEWGLESDDDFLMKKTVFIISRNIKGNPKKVFNKIFMSEAYTNQLKTVALYTAMRLGVKKGIDICSNYHYTRQSLGKAKFEDEFQGDDYVIAYAIAVMEVAAYGQKEKSRVLYVLEKLYDEFFSETENLGLIPRDLAAIALYFAGIEGMHVIDLKENLGKKFPAVKKNIIDKFKED